MKHFFFASEFLHSCEFQVYLNALGLMLRVCVRDELEIFGDRLKVLADRVKYKVSQNGSEAICPIIYIVQCL